LSTVFAIFAYARPKPLVVELGLINNLQIMGKIVWEFVEFEGIIGLKGLF